MTTQDTTKTITPDTADTEQDLFTKQQSKCEKWLRMVQDSSPLIQFLSRYTNPTVKCTACPPDRLSGFALENGIFLCSNTIPGKDDLEHALAHEMIHDYDYKTTSIQFDKLDHLTCTEIRASTLSTECSFMNEVKRGNFGLKGWHQVCVRRRVLKSLLLAGYTEQQGKESMERVFKNCFNDTAPFEAIY